MTFDEIVSISRVPDQIRRFIDCYLQARDEGMVGLQSALPMRELAPVMANVTLMERLNSEEIIYRIVGDHIVEQMGFNPTGTNLFDLLAPEMQQRLSKINDVCLKRPCGHYFLHERTTDSEDRVIVENLVLPMRRAETTEAALVLGCHFQHHLAHDFDRSSKTSLVGTVKVNKFVDIGFGVPAMNLETTVAS